MYTENIAFGLANWPLETERFILLIEMTFKTRVDVNWYPHLTLIKILWLIDFVISASILLYPTLRLKNYYG